jgi:hypothetical protein
MTAFWIDHEYDREHAEVGSSRYGEHVRREVAQFADSWGDIAPVTFACVAWRLSTPASLPPGYVRWHRRILDATCVRNAWDGGLTARVTLVSPLPAELTWSRQWWRDRGWRGWPEMFGQFLQPSEQDISRSPHLRASLLVEAPLPLGELPPAPPGPGDDLDQTARRAVAVVVRELNELLTPVLAQIEGPHPTVPKTS